MIKREIPVIGISTEIDIPGRISVKRKYVDAVLQAGGIPFILPFTDNVQILQSVVSSIVFRISKQPKITRNIQA